MKIQPIVAIILLFFYQSGFTQRIKGLIGGQDNEFKHLEPTSNLFDRSDEGNLYEANLKKVLLGSSYFDLRLIVISAEFPESVLEIRQDSTIATIELRTCQKKVWASKDQVDIKVKTIQKNISKKTADLVYELFKVAIYQSRYVDTNMITSGGDVHYFSVYDKGVKTAMTHMPKEGSIIFDLVRISDELIFFAKNENEELSPDLLKRMKKIKRKLN